MDTVNMRAIITQCFGHEHRTSELAWLLRSRLHNLHSAIRISSANPAVYLLDFVQRYVERLPDILDAMWDISRLQGTDDVAEAIIDRCVELFASPPQLLVGHNGLNGAMNTAYMALRLVEEVNDYHLLSRGNALLPLDTTGSNLVVHQLIGESFANQLDEAVRLIAAELIGQWGNHLPDRLRVANSPNVSEMLQRWPCLRDCLGGDVLRVGAFAAPSIH